MKSLPKRSSSLTNEGLDVGEEAEAWCRKVYGDVDLVGLVLWLFEEVARLRAQIAASGTNLKKSVAIGDIVHPMDVAVQAVKICLRDLEKYKGKKISSEMLEELNEHWCEMVSEAEYEDDDDESTCGICGVTIVIPTHAAGIIPVCFKCDKAQKEKLRD